MTYNKGWGGCAMDECTYYSEKQAWVRHRFDDVLVKFRLASI
jgi:hypothetical protein